MKKKYVEKLINNHVNIIPVTLYNYDILLIHGISQKDAAKVLSQFQLPKKSIDTYAAANFSEVANTVQLDSGHIIIYFGVTPTTVKDLGFVIHEIFHATSFLLSTVGIEFCEETEEAYAYLIQYLSENIIPIFIGDQ